MNYSFYYDETEHSRKITYNTVSASNYYDFFTAVIVGWNENDENDIINKYLEVEEKYDYRKKDGELKSDSIKKNDFKLGFASLNKNTITFYEELLSFYDEKILLYISCFSKLEYLIGQILNNYENSIMFDADAMKYSIVKAINVYQPEKLLSSIYSNPKDFTKELKNFLQNRIAENEKNIDLKKRENTAFEQILMVLENVESVEEFEWQYSEPFKGFQQMLLEGGISSYRLAVDNESKTCNTAIEVGIQNVREEDSISCVGVRIADMMAGFLSRFMQILCLQLRANYSNGVISKTLLDSGWFVLNERQFQLYKKLYKIVCEYNNFWYKTYLGYYADDLVAFISLLQFINHFNTVDELKNEEIKMLPEYYNSFVCEQLGKRYSRMRNKLPIEFIGDNNCDYFINDRGAAVYYDEEKQPLLYIDFDEKIYEVLSVGVIKNHAPLITIKENETAACYRLPNELLDWAIDVVALSNIGGKFFPATMAFSLNNEKYNIRIIE